MQRITRLTPLADVLARVAAAVEPVAPQVLPVDAAIGAVLASDVAAAGDLPPVPLALRDGWAVRSDDLLDAGSYTAVPLGTPPAWVEAGDAMPPGTDAVAPADAVAIRGGAAEAVATVAPGEGVLAPGGDAIAGAALLAAGRRVDAVAAAVLAAVGRAEVAARRPRVRVVAPVRPGTFGAAAADLLHRLLAAGGAAVAKGDADLIVGIGGTGEGRADAAVGSLARDGHVECHGIAIAPGESSAFGFIGRCPVLLLPGRLDAALAAWLLLGDPLLARLSGAAMDGHARQVPLARKIASPIGLTEVVPVRVGRAGAEPLASGPWPLAAIAGADGWVLVPAGSEGHPPGRAVDVRPWPRCT